MLLIRRKPGESILIGPDVLLEVIEVSGGRVKLGISAPPEVVILRKEIQIAQEQNRKAARELTPRGMRALLDQVRPADRKPSSPPHQRRVGFSVVPRAERPAGGGRGLCPAQDG